MIFVSLGSQKFQFNRLLIMVDSLVKDQKIKESVFAQTGASDYVPKNYPFSSFLTREEFKLKISKCDIVITHGGTGAILTALKSKKKVIVVPRLARYGEHVDDHQIQITNNFRNENYILTGNTESELLESYNKIENHKFNSFSSNNSTYIDFLMNEI
ncbi:MAG TPA: beta(1,3)galactosyltransferase EpsH [Bavariicoccus seileri]|uniref:Beta(1,3)galactosyltransferase EpsH n=1 Tax=Bavariicoccus seileri TaxID=549685 RepID=A0A3D4S7M1_9ENTE|nr:PssE/Cps14G family polysaccharide biosynthesis glycosyltransferase [Bavariicoccus seileri]HCS93961.1 beta(1,3)galactosyltransferase EpsH [Bavariicoccus seileri]